MKVLYKIEDNEVLQGVPPTLQNVGGTPNGLSKDIEAIKSAVSSTFSNGYVEGNNYRLKMIKRIMYRRAGLPLLKAKILY